MAPDKQMSLIDPIALAPLVHHAYNIPAGGLSLRSDRLVIIAAVIQVYHAG